MLVCSNCGARNHNPGGDPRLYTCGRCGQPTLSREQGPSPQASGMASGVLGVGLGWALGGPPGAVVGGIIGLLLGSAREGRRS